MNSASNSIPYKTDFDWSRECDYIHYTTTDCLGHGASHRSMKSFNYDKACFVRYCEMQRDCATRDGHHDSATYIQECLDDLIAY